ncbi:patatin-like phospholipase family protein [Brevundimonas lenta]|uniref:Putative acylesterase/phospholipase RssA n=1 Tax=Brevundimonas lenta TaxID=424796 RepID=A0A7W6JBA0_9CAUL|nr:patatin-like phospholipase family protein [Brevundimonas lenta]MBB4081941.1 putative acylesterase/phospholipase RssA [Brevundimonas lenta]
MGRLLLGAAAVLQLQLAACATPVRMPAVPSELTAQAEVAIPNARFFPDRDPGPLAEEGLQSLRREMAWRRESGQTGPLPPVSFLTISGGGGDGAFGAGLLTGWTESGTRPEFKLVTGISTGALIAPFAFLGSRYDPILKETYTGVSDSDIFHPRDFTAALFDDAMADTAPMAHLVERYVTRELLDAIAVEYAHGRLLVIGTTNLDAREPVYWNMGAIASSRDPAALPLFRKIILASASIPGAFPPQMFDVTAGGQSYQEMHVDGGATRQVFMYPPSIHLGELAAREDAVRTRHLYIIRNSRLDPDWASVDRRTLSIANRAVSSLIQTQGVGDLTRIYLTATRDGLDYNLAYIPADFTVPKTSEFDPVYMSQLFDRARQMATAGYVWDKAPPGFAAVTVP